MSTLNISDPATTPRYKLARVEEAMVVACQRVQNQTILLVRCLDSDIHSPNAPIEQLTRVIMTSNIATMGGDRGGPVSVPEVGSKVLILYQYPDSFYQAYYIGQINDRTATNLIQSAPNVEEGGVNFSTPSGAGLRAHGSKSEASIFSGDGSIRISNEEASIKIGSGNYFTLSRREISMVREDNLSGLIMGGDTALFSKGNIDIKSANGEVTISGNSITFDSRGGTIEKRVSVLKEVTQKRIYSDATFKHIIGTAEAFGSSTAYELSIVSGDLSVFSASGDMDWTCIDPTNAITHTIGPSAAVAAQVKIESDKIKTYVNSTSGGEIFLSSSPTQAVDKSYIRISDEDVFVSTGANAGISDSSVNLTTSELKIKNGSNGIASNQILMNSTKLEFIQGKNLISSNGSIISMKDGGEIVVTAKNKITIESLLDDIDIVASTINLEGDVNVKMGELKVDDEITWNNSGTPTKASTHLHTNAVPGPPTPPTPGS